MKLDYEQCIAWLGREYEESAGVAEIDGEAYIFALDSYDEEQEGYTEVWQMDDEDDEITVDRVIGFQNTLDISSGEARVAVEYYFID